MPEYIQRYRALLALLRQPHLLTDDVSLQCDEARPRCTACTRHNVPCVYAHAPSSNTLEPQERPSEPANGPYYDQPEQNGSVPVEAFDHMLELRLMHEWTAYTSKTFSTTWEFWYYQAPFLALEYRYLLDAMLAIAALHASKQPPAQWNPIEGRGKFTSSLAMALLLSLCSSGDWPSFTPHWTCFVPTMSFNLRHAVCSTALATLLMFRRLYTHRSKT